MRHDVSLLNVFDKDTIQTKTALSRIRKIYNIVDLVFIFFLPFPWYGEFNNDATMSQMEGVNAACAIMLSCGIKLFPYNVLFAEVYPSLYDTSLQLP